MRVAAGAARSSDRDGRVKPGHDRGGVETARFSDRPLPPAPPPPAGRGGARGGGGGGRSPPASPIGPSPQPSPRTRAEGVLVRERESGSASLVSSSLTMFLLC